ncbi:MAG: glycosyltransferase family 2 protein [Lachnospiraceae bacterium]|nr:glycosyltransferase family 2 protein [Lachnospiraceae bacterium]
METKAVLVILNYNDSETTLTLCKKIKDYQVFEKIILVDNCSSDDSYDRLKEFEVANDRIILIQTQENGGYAKGNNFGIRFAIEMCNPEVVFVANPDVFFEEMVAVRMLEALEKNQDAGVIAPIVNQGYNVWNQPGYWGMIEELFLVWFNIDKLLIKRKLLKNTSIEEVGVVEGSFFAMPAAAWSKVGGFDERTFLYCEEIILGKRMKTNGYRTLVLTGERYDHLHSQSIRKQYQSKAKAFVNFYDSFYLYLKEYLGANKAQIWFYRVCYQLAYLERKVYDLIKR